MATFERHEGRNLKGIDPDAKDRDLEQYGIWVKAEPQDVLEEPDIGDAALLSETPEGTTVLDESFLTDEAEVFLDAGDESSEGAGEKSEDIFLTTSETPSLQEEELVVPTMEETPTDVQEDLPRIPDMAEFESLDDLGVPIEEFTPEEPLNASARNTDLEEFPEISDFGLEEAEPVLEAGAETDFEALDIDLKFDDTLPPSPEAQGAAVDHSKPSSADGFETVTDFDDFLSGSESGPGVDLEPSESLAAPAASPGPEPKAAPPRAGDEFSLEDIPEMPPAQSIDDMAELERDLAGSGVAAASPRGAADASSDILLKIAGELSSIKDELVSLKAQIAAMKAAGTAPGESPAEAEKAGGGKAGGFFDEEEDETIALTGDELDNILNTAEFSEESAEPTPLQESSETQEELGDLLPETGDYTEDLSAEAQGSGIEELRLSETEEDMAVPEPAEEEISALAEEGVAPLTPPPEDTSYLEEAEDLELAGEEDLAEAPLLEPSPEELNIDEILEDHLEEAEELPLAEFESAEGLEEASGLEEESEELEELTLDLDSEPSALVLESPENIEMPIPELDEEIPSSRGPAPEFVEEIGEGENADNLGEITLHNEEAHAPVGAAVPEAEELEPVDFEDLKTDTKAVVPEEPETLLVEDLEPTPAPKAEPVPSRIKDEVRSVLTYLDKLLEALPEEKIEEFANSEHYETYKRLFEELGLV